MADTTQPPVGTLNLTSPKGGLYGGLITNPTGTDKDTLNTVAELAGMRWTSDVAGTIAATNITYFFPTSVADYTADATYPDQKEISTFKPLSAAQQQIALLSMAMIASYTKVTFTLAKSGLAADAALRFSQYAGTGSEARFPTNNGAYSPIDARSAGENFEGGNAVPPATGSFWGTDAFATIAHELGHSVGLKHGHDNSFNGALSADRNDSEYSHMTYATYLGAPTGNPTPKGGALIAELGPDEHLNHGTS